MNRRDFQLIANLRVKEAQVLIDNGCYEGAYYLLGYAVECAFKACIAKQTQLYDFPDRKLATDSHTHDLEKLLSVSGLKGDHVARIKADAVFAKNWAYVRDWSEQSRYETTISEDEAVNLFTAVTSPRNGVLPWIKKYW